MRFVFLLILLLPIAEIWCLIEVGSRIGVLPVIALLIIGGMVGSQLLKYQGMSTLLRINEKLAAGELPAQDIVKGLLTALAGLLFIIPGFITDVLALMCLFPPTRYLLVKQILAHPGFIQVKGMNFSAGFTAGPDADSNIYEGEYRKTAEDEPRLPPAP